MATNDKVKIGLAIGGIVIFVIIIVVVVVVTAPKETKSKVVEREPESKPVLPATPAQVPIIDDLPPAPSSRSATIIEGRLSLESDVEGSRPRSLVQRPPPTRSNPNLIAPQAGQIRSRGLVQKDPVRRTQRNLVPPKEEPRHIHGSDDSNDSSSGSGEDVSEDADSGTNDSDGSCTGEDASDNGSCAGSSCSQVSACGAKGNACGKKVKAYDRSKLTSSIATCTDLCTDDEGCARKACQKDCPINTIKAQEGFWLSIKNGDVYETIVQLPGPVNDFRWYSDQIVVAMQNGQIYLYTIDANTRVVANRVVTSSLIMLYIVQYIGVLYGLGVDGFIYALDMSTYATDNWIWNKQNFTGGNHNYLNASLDGGILWIQDTDGSATSYQGFPPAVVNTYPYPAFATQSRVYGLDDTTYIDVNLNHTAVKEPGTQAYLWLDLAVIDYNGNVITTPEGSKPLLPLLRIVNWVAVYGSNQPYSWAPPAP